MTPIPQHTSLPAPRRTQAPLRATPGSRLIAGIMAIACLGLLATASSLSPDPRGVETHTQLGLWPCGWYAASGFPCPTCGMTTAFAAAARGQYWLSLRTQPFAAGLALVTAVLFWAGLHTALLGSRLGAIGDRLLRPRAAMLLAGCLLLSWLYKIAAMRGL